MSPQVLLHTKNLPDSCPHKRRMRAKAKAIVSQHNSLSVEDLLPKGLDVRHCFYCKAFKKIDDWGAGTALYCAQSRVPILLWME